MSASLVTLDQLPKTPPSLSSLSCKMAFIRESLADKDFVRVHQSTLVYCF